MWVLTLQTSSLSSGSHLPGDTCNNGVFRDEQSGLP